MSRSATVVGPIRATDVRVPVPDREDPEAPARDENLTRDEAVTRVENAREMAPSDARELSRHFFRRLRSLEEGTREYQYTRNTLIEMNLSLVQFAARRFRARVMGG
ncbi:RNA polymerase sigma factor SigF, partial [Streptomyces erythrochromogenes]